MENKMIPRW